MDAYYVRMAITGTIYLVAAIVAAWYALNLALITIWAVSKLCTAAARVIPLYVAIRIMNLFGSGTLERITQHKQRLGEHYGSITPAR